MATIIKLPKFGLNFGFWKNSSPFYHQHQVGVTEPIYIDLSNVETAYYSVPHLQIVINRKAEMLSNLEWTIKNNKGEVVESHWLLDLLNNPNPLQNGKGLIFQLSVCKSIYGNAFVKKLKAFSSSKPRCYYVLDSQGMKVNLTGKLYDQYEISGIIKDYELELNEINQKFEVDEILHLRMASNKPIVAESPVKTLKDQLSNIEGAYKSRNILLNNRGMLGMISMGNSKGEATIPMSPKEKKEAEEKLTKHYGIQQGQKPIGITTLPFNWHPMSFPTKDLLLFEEIEDDFKVICDTYGIRREVFSTVDGTTFENQNTALKSTYQNTIIPEANYIAEVFNTEIESEGLKLEANLEHIPVLQEDKKEQAEVLEKMVDTLLKLLERGIISEADAKAKIDEILMKR